MSANWVSKLSELARMRQWGLGPEEDSDLRYTCPKCRRIFGGPTEDWLCPSCKETLRILGALKLQDRRRSPASFEDLDDQEQNDL